MTSDLFQLVDAGDPAALREALSEGADANALDLQLRTPLMLAAEAGRLDLVELLLEAGADPSLRDAQEETPLLKAAAQGHGAVYSRLLRLAAPEDKAFAAQMLASAPAGSGLLRGPGDPREETPWTDRAAKAGAYVADKLGDAQPKSRLARVLRSRKPR